MRRSICHSLLAAALAFGLVAVPATRAVAPSALDPRAFGARADGQTVDTAAIQAAIDAAHVAGGGTVRLAGGTFVSGTILLKDHVTLEIAEGATLLGSTDPRDYHSIDPFVDATGQTRGKCLVGALDAEKVALTGRGTIDGRGQAFDYETLRKRAESWGITGDAFKPLAADRPFLIRFVRCRDVTLRGLHLRQPAAWTVHFYQTDDILVEDLDIHSHAHRNNDGIDLDSSRRAVIRNCRIDTGDDAICLKTTSPRACEDIAVSGCDLRSEWGAIKFGTESMGDFRRITIRDCTIRDTRGGGIKLLSVDGAHIADVAITDITMRDVDMPIFIRLGERLRTYRDAPPQTVGSIDGVSIAHVIATARARARSRVDPPTGIFITGTPKHPIGRVRLEDITITLPGGGTTEHAVATVPEREADYPEFSFFGVLPAYGLYARHIHGLETHRVRFSLTGPDTRPEIILIDTCRNPHRP
ncbi:MAG: glycoside hydrolase family 28 protein [Verrucomicrobia bacterium]|nr:MAG: glycoside hydrolase family 28 protein [Verrucomicrobiota bacterium]